MADEKKDVTAEDLVTRSNIEQVLKADKGQGAQLVSWKLKEFTKKGDNYACTVLAAHIKYSCDDKEDESSYVVKLNPMKGMFHDAGLTSVIFSKEAKFYTEILPELNEALKNIQHPYLNLPKCFYTMIDCKPEQIYFEDLRERDFVMFDRKKGMDMMHASLVLKEMARLHAAGYILQKSCTEPLETKYDYLTKDYLSFTEDSREMMLGMIAGPISTTVQLLEHIGGYETSVSWLHIFKDEVEEVLENMTNGKYDVIGHGDCWNNNLLFRYDERNMPEEVMLIDLQLCRKASPAIDLNYFLYTSLTGEIRRPNLNELLKIYYNSFKNVIEGGNLIMPFTEQELHEEFRNKNKIGLLFSIISIPMLLMESEDALDLNKEGQDIEKLNEDVRQKSMDLLTKSPLLKPRFISIFDEFLDNGLIK